MTKSSKKQIGQLHFHLDQPTEVMFSELTAWVIWQFPHSQHSTLPGAVHPPIASHGWLPAHVLPHQQRVIVHAHLGQTYLTPEAAAAAI